MKTVARAISGVVASFSLAGLMAAAPAIAAEPMPAQNVVQVVSSRPDLSTLTKAVEAAGLQDTLATKQDITLFAPTDEAFNRLPAGELDRLLANKEQLTNVLEFHVIAQRVSSTSAVTMDQATMLNGAIAKIKFDGQNLFIDNAKVIEKDIQASNGVIHIVDAVLLPQQVN